MGRNLEEKGGPEGGGPGNAEELDRCPPLMCWGVIGERSGAEPVYHLQEHDNSGGG